MKIGVIGDAPAGPVLAKAWAAAGHELVGVFVEGPEAIGRVEALIPDVPIANMAAVVEDADLVLLAIPSNDIEITCAGLADLGLFGPRVSGPARFLCVQFNHYPSPHCHHAPEHKE